MPGITPFGLFHTAISLLSLFAGLYLLLRRHEIRYAWPAGKLYAWVTVATCITGLFIFRHGRATEAHALAVLTLVVLAAAAWLERGARPGSWRAVAATAGYTLTVFFHFIPGFTETLTRVPAGSPLVAGPQDPRLQALVAASFAVFAAAMVVQAVRQRRQALAGVASPAA